MTTDNPCPLNPLLASQLEQILEAAEYQIEKQGLIDIRVMFSTYGQDHYFIHCFVKGAVTLPQIKKNVKAEVRVQSGQWMFPAMSLENFCALYEEGLTKNQIRVQEIPPEDVGLRGIIVSYRIENEPGHMSQASAKQASETARNLTIRMYNALSQG